MCQGLGPKKHDEISEIDRTGPFRTHGARARQAAQFLNAYYYDYYYHYYCDYYYAYYYR